MDRSHTVIVDADEFEAARRDPRVHALLASADRYGRRLVAPAPGIETSVPQDLWDPVAERFGDWHARRFFEAPNAHMQGRAPASVMRHDAGAVRDAIAALLNA